MSQNQFLSLSKSHFFNTFRRELLLQMAVEWWEMNLETCFGYEKHSSGSGQYVSKKNQGHVIRRSEIIAGNRRKS